jgi:hypothetical protein
MPNLGDYIGQVMAEITLARVQADLEAVRLADYYANHPLLKTFPVPRFRLPTVNLDFPVAISTVQEPQRARGLNMAQAQQVFTTTLNEHFNQSGIRLTTAESRNINSAVKKRFAGMKTPDFISTSTVHVADSVTNTVDEALPVEALKGAERARFISDLRNHARVALLKLLPSPLRVKVVTNTADLRELGPMEVLTRIQLNISEQGVEWKGDENKGGGGKRLLPE